MIMFDKSKANTFVFAVVPKSAKEGTAPTYQAIAGLSVDDCESTIFKHNNRPAYPHCMGRYDEHGRYCIYCPPIDGIAPGKFIVHPLAAEEHKRQRAYV